MLAKPISVSASMTGLRLVSARTRGSNISDVKVSRSATKMIYLRVQLMRKFLYG